MTTPPFVPSARREQSGLTRRAVLASLASAAPMLTAACGDGDDGPSKLGLADDSADTIVAKYMQQYMVPGLSLAIARGPSILTARAYGFANTDTGENTTTDSRFRIASLSKALTSTAIFQLVEAGRLGLDDMVFTPDGLLPDFYGFGTQPDWLTRISVRHLLTHTAGGWSNDGNDPMFQKLGLNQLQLIADTLQTHLLDHAPGNSYAYSNFGYCVLGRVIERLAGMPYAQHVRQQVLAPVGSAAMVIGVRAPHPNEVRYVAQDGGDPYKMDVARMDSHGGWVATASELVRFVAGAFSVRDGTGAPRLLQASSLATATTSTAANPAYGCGWQLNSAGNCWHTGSLPGTTTIMVHTATGLSWVALLNARSADPNAAGDLDRMMWNVARSLGYV